MFYDAPQPENCMRLGTPLAPLAEPYGLRGTLEILGGTYDFSDPTTTDQEKHPWPRKEHVKKLWASLVSGLVL